MVFNREILQSFTEKQIAYLHEVYDDCKERGATLEMLVPFGALVWVNWQPITDPKLLEFVHRTGRELAEELKKEEGYDNDCD